MNKNCVSTNQAPAAVGPYSQAVIHGDLIYCSGQIPLVPESGELAGPGYGQQTRQCILNLQAVLKAAGASLSHVIKTTIYITDMAQFHEVNSVYGEFFNAPYPARSCIEVAGLPKGACVEVEAVAVKQ